MKRDYLITIDDEYSFSANAGLIRLQGVSKDYRDGYVTALKNIYGDRVKVNEIQQS